MPRIRCAYTPRVMIADACPRRSETTFTGTPDANRIDACVCLRSRLCRRRHNHDLRHTHVAWLVAGGAPLPHIQARLGHESITTTIDTYGHLLPAGDELISAIIETALTGGTIRPAKVVG
jgi:integrase